MQPVKATARISAQRIAQNTAGVRAVGPPQRRSRRGIGRWPPVPQTRAAASRCRSAPHEIALKQQRRAAAVLASAAWACAAAMERQGAAPGVLSARCCTSGEANSDGSSRSRPVPRLSVGRGSRGARCDRYSRSPCRAQPRRYGAGWRTGRSPAPPLPGWTKSAWCKRFQGWRGRDGERQRHRTEKIRRQRRQGAGRHRWQPERPAPRPVAPRRLVVPPPRGGQAARAISMSPALSA